MAIELVKNLIGTSELKLYVKSLTFFTIFLIKRSTGEQKCRIRASSELFPHFSNDLYTSVGGSVDLPNI